MHIPKRLTRFGVGCPAHCADVPGKLEWTPGCPCARARSSPV
ncbi:hypothetical protein FM113_13045 [Leucobacter sp. 7(1)]|nr:hypothetical protein FM113_13045 [Leucobacter sp. 7(1)]